MPDQTPQSETGWRDHQTVEDGYAAIYRMETPWLVRFFRRQVGNDADAQDLTQETMLRFIRAAPSVDVATPQAYLRRIAINLVRDRAQTVAVKIANRSTPLIEGLDRADDFDQHRLIAAREELASWELLLGKLKPRTLEIFLLSRVDGYSYNEIAAALGMTVWNVKKHMTKAIAHVERHRRQL